MIDYFSHVIPLPIGFMKLHRLCLNMEESEVNERNKTFQQSQTLLGPFVLTKKPTPT